MKTDKESATPAEIEESFRVSDVEANKVVRASRVKGRINVSWAIRQRISRAIVLIHHQARYFEGMAILSALCGWKPRILENEFDPPDVQAQTRKQFNDWVRKLAG